MEPNSEEEGERRAHRPSSFLHPSLLALRHSCDPARVGELTRATRSRLRRAGDYGVKLGGESSEGTFPRPGETPPLGRCLLTPPVLTLKRNPAFLPCLAAAGSPNLTASRSAQIPWSFLYYSFFKVKPNESPICWIIILKKQTNKRSLLTV